MWRIRPRTRYGLTDGEMAYEVYEHQGVVAIFRYREDADEYVALKFPEEHARLAREAAEGRDDRARRAARARRGEKCEVDAMVAGAKPWVFLPGIPGRQIRTVPVPHYLL